MDTTLRCYAILRIYEGGASRYAEAKHTPSLMKATPTILMLAAAAVLLPNASALRAQSPPPNDDFANRQVIPSELQVTVDGTTDYATQEPFEKVYGGGEAYGYGINERNTVWYDYTAPVSGVMHLSATREINSESYTLVFKGGATPYPEHGSSTVRVVTLRRPAF